MLEMCAQGGSLQVLSLRLNFDGGSGFRRKSEKTVN